MTFVRRRRRRRTPSSAEMGPAGPVRKDSCGVRHYGPASIALPFGWGRCSSGADATAPVGKETHCVFVVPGPHMTAIPPVFGPMPARRLPPFRPVEPGTPVGPAPVRHPRRAQRRKRARSVPVRSRRLVSGPQGGRCPDRIPRLRQARIDSPPAITAGTGSLCPSKGCLAGRGVMICPRAAHARLRSPGVAVGERQDQSADRTAAHRLERDREAAVATSPLGCRAQAARAGSSRGPGSPEGNARHQAPAAAPAQARVRRPSS